VAFLRSRMTAGSGEPRRYEVAGELCISERTLTQSQLYMSDL
jgi:hypothetical protein